MPRRLISTKQELQDNLQTFISYSKSNLEEEREFFRESLSRGRCFVVNENGSQFAPSRFLGYVANNMTDHKRDEEKHGEAKLIMLLIKSYNLVQLRILR